MIHIRVNRAKKALANIEAQRAQAIKLVNEKIQETKAAMEAETDEAEKTQLEYRLWRYELDKSWYEGGNKPFSGNPRRRLHAPKQNSQGGE